MGLVWKNSECVLDWESSLRAERQTLKRMLEEQDVRIEWNGTG
jgi:hypothetical protein